MSYYTETVMEESQMDMDTEEDMYTLSYAVHHMTIACIAADLDYLANEINDLKSWYDMSEMTDDDKEKLASVSLQAAMDGRVKCLKILYDMDIPMDEMCPIIAANHGQEEVLEFCEDYGIGDTEDAWKQYHNWQLCQFCSSQSAEMEETLINADEWVRNYKASHVNYYHGEVVASC